MLAKLEQMCALSSIEGDACRGCGWSVLMLKRCPPRKQVHSAVEEDRTRRRSAVRGASHMEDSDSSCSGSSSVEDTDEEDESEAEDAIQGEEGEGGPPQSGKCSVAMAIDGESGQIKRRSRLGERVVRVLAQCQACLYDVAVVPCEVRRNATLGTS